MTQRNLNVAVNDLIHSVGLLVRRVRAAAGSHELSWGESGVMARLANEGPATTAELARAEGVEPQSMGAIVATLEEMGMIERKAHPTDGRQVMLSLSAKGIATRKSVEDAKRTWLAEAIGALKEEDREALFKAGEIIKRLLEK